MLFLPIPYALEWDILGIVRYTHKLPLFLWFGMEKRVNCDFLFFGSKHIYIAINVDNFGFAVSERGLVVFGATYDDARCDIFVRFLLFGYSYL